MQVGDVLEWLAAIVFAVAAYLATGWVWPSLVVVGVALVYFGQCYASRPLRLGLRAWWRGRVR